MPRRLAALVATVALVVGCDGAPPHDTESEAVLSPITYALWQERLKSYEPNIVVVDFWATWCTPCVERFPHMVEMAERYRERGVRFVSMSMEDREDREAVAGAERFLIAQKAGFDHFLLDEPLLEGFKHFDLLSVPAVYVYDGTGSLATRLTGEDPNEPFDEGDVEKAIEAQLTR